MDIELFMPRGRLLTSLLYLLWASSHRGVVYDHKKQLCYILHWLIDCLTDVELICRLIARIG